MMWFITLLVLALAAFLIIRAYQAHAERQAAQRDRLAEGSGLAGNLSQDRSSAQNAADTVTTTATDSDNGGSAKVADAVTPVSGGSSSGSVAGAAGGGSSGTVAGAAVAASAMAAGVAASHGGLQTSDTLADVREMIKILNLAEPDAARLAVSREQFAALRRGDPSAAPKREVVSEVADKLRRMLA